MKADITAVLLFDLACAVDVIEVRMGVNDCLYAESVVFHDFANLLHLTTWVDNECFFALVAGNHGTVASECTSGKCFSKEHAAS